MIKFRRAGQQEAASPPIRAHRAIEVSARVPAEPGRGGEIRGLAEHIEARRQLPESWRQVWAEELRAMGEVP